MPDNRKLKILAANNVSNRKNTNRSTFGNWKCQNRFISCEYVNGFLDFTTAQVVHPDNYYKKVTVKWLNSHYAYVEHSILTEAQRHYIRECIPF